MKMRSLLIALPLLLGSIPATYAQVSVSIGINVPVYPRLVLVPGYPVYYDPRANSNYFFYDGLYWVYQGDNWYASSWYNGPWELTEPEYVPLYVLRVPVSYYRRPPVYFHGWRGDAPPQWGARWGRDWERHHTGWDRWDRRATPHAAPLPTYQRQFSGQHYPRAIEQQESIRSDHYRYQPREAVTRQHFEQQRNQVEHGNQGNGRTERQAQPQPQPSLQQRSQPDAHDIRRNEQRPPMPPQATPERQPEPRRQPDAQYQPNQPSRGPAQRAEPQGNGREDRGESRDRGREDRGDARDNGIGNRNDERGPDRR